jgi:hypothetical protein
MYNLFRQARFQRNTMVIGNHLLLVIGLLATKKYRPVGGIIG